MLHLHSLGQCMITLGATRIVPTAKLMFASALYVAVEGVRPIARESMASLFWPELDEEKATHSLRQALYRLRATGVPINGDSERIQVPDGVVTTDFSALLASDASVPVSEMLERIPGGFLPGYLPSISGPFAEWVEGQRERVNAVLRRQLVSGIITLRAAGDWPATQALAQRCLELDPLNEEATLAMAEAMAMDGSKARAIMLIERYMNEVGPRSKELYLPATTLKKRISELYPLPPVIEREPPHTGREEQMEMLDAALKDARQGRGSAFLISGPPGMGKTRLVTEFTRAAQLQGIATARSQMGRHDDHRPLGAWSDVVPTLQRMAGALGCDPESLPFLRRLTTYDSTQTTPSPETQDAEYLFARMRMSIIDLVCAVASESCVILLVEDVHWMDEWSWDVMTALTKKLEKTGVVILMTRRDGEEPSTPVPDNAVLQEVELEPLADAKCRKLLGYVMPAAKASDQEFADWCVRTCSGNPYFLIELGRRASCEDGKFVAPPSLRRLVAQRFQDVSPLSRRFLQVASILGSRATVLTIEKVLGENRAALLDALDELTRAQLVRSDGLGVRCQHDLLGLSAIHDASSLSLALLHHHSATVLQQDLRDNASPDDLWDVAQHWEAAGRQDLANRLLDRCATRALELGAPSEAVRVLDYVIDHTPLGEARSDLCDRLIRALYLARECARIVTLSRARTGGDSYTGLRCASSTEELFALDSRYFCDGGSRDLISQTLVCASEESAGATHRVGAALIGCKAAYALGDAESGEKLMSSVRQVLSTASPELATELRVIYHASFGDPTEGAAAARSLRGMRIGGEGRTLRTRTLVQCAIAFLINGELAEVDECMEEAMALAKKLQMPAHVRSTWFAVLSILSARGEAAALDQVLAEPSPIAPGSREQYGERIYARVRARRALELGDLRAAELALGSFDSIWGNDEVAEELFTTETRAHFRLAAGIWTPTEDELDRLLRLHARWRERQGHDTFLALLIEILVLSGRVPKARALADDYLARHRRERGPLHPRLREALAELHAGVVSAPALARRAAAHAKR